MPFRTGAQGPVPSRRAPPAIAGAQAQTRRAILAHVHVPCITRVPDRQPDPHATVTAGTHTVTGRMHI